MLKARIGKRIRENIGEAYIAVLVLLLALVLYLPSIMVKEIVALVSFCAALYLAIEYDLYGKYFNKKDEPEDTDHESKPELSLVDDGEEQQPGSDSGTGARREESP